MLSTREGAAVSPVGGGAEPPGSRPRPGGLTGARGGEEEKPRGFGVQEWPDGSRYEGEFVGGLKHGRGKYTWRNGEFYEGSFYKDYRHGDGTYSWPSGLKFTGKFYLNRKEGWGRQAFPDGATFRGLYRAEQRFGPGVIGYPDGRNDVGLWLGERLLKLCVSVGEGFSLKDFPGYAAYMDPVATTNSLPQVDADRDLPSDDNFILPPGIETYSTDGDHLPLPPDRRRELDRLFYGELWETVSQPYQGYERDPLSTLPLHARMQAHMQTYRLLADSLDRDMAAVLSLNREGFGPKGPLEVSSELLIQHASRGELQAVSRILKSDLVLPDVADSEGHTALIAATVNCHNHVIQLLLDMGADIDQLNCEGMSALAVCHVLYYPFQSLQAGFAESPTKTQASRLPSPGGNSFQISQVDFPAHSPRMSNRPQTAKTTLSGQTNRSTLSGQTTEEATELISKGRPGSSGPETPSDKEHLREEESKEKRGEEEGEEARKETETLGQFGETEERSWREDEKESKGEERVIESRCDQTFEQGENEINGREFEKIENRGKNVELCESREAESGKENAGEGVEKGISHTDEEEVKEEGREECPDVDRLIQVLDGHIALDSVQRRDYGAETAGRVQIRSTGVLSGQDGDKEVTPNPTFDPVSSRSLQVTEETLSQTGVPRRSDTRETVRKMAAMKTERRVRLSTLKLLLERGADPNVSKVPMPVLFLAIMAADVEAVRRLLLSGARTDVPLPPERKGVYPLHVAAALPGPAGPSITEMLLHAITDPDARACDHDEIYEPDKIPMKTQEPLSTDENPHLKEGGRTALHVACQRGSDYQNASKVVALLLSHRASTDLLWSGHSPLSLAIAAGNELAVEELLKGGADPNLPLGCRVGSALCALTNINYRSGGNRAKLLEMLARAGADILMPVAVGDVVGTAVDCAHRSFNQDLRIAGTPFHALSMQEMETFKARRHLLGMMGDLLRKTAGQRERESLEKEQQCGSSSERYALFSAGAGSGAGTGAGAGAGAISSSVPLPSCESLPPITGKQRKAAFSFCYQCGRSASVNLTACSRCRKVFYCSRTCKLEAWNERHKKECIRVSASAVGLQKSVVFKSHRVPEPLSMAGKVLESRVNSRENYSSN